MNEQTGIFRDVDPFLSTLIGRDRRPISVLTTGAAGPWIRVLINKWATVIREEFYLINNRYGPAKHHIILTTQFSPTACLTWIIACSCDLWDSPGYKTISRPEGPQNSLVFRAISESES